MLHAISIRGNMLITSYEYAHQVVEKNNVLSWNGWDIVETKQNPAAEFTETGQRINGVWSYVNIYPLTENGWEVPKKYVRA